MKRCRYKSFAVSYLFACLPILGARVDPPPPCVFHGSEPGECHVSIESELRIKKGTGGFELVVKTKNRSRASVFVVESNARYDFSVAVKDLWGNAVPLTESEKSHRSPLRSTLNFVLELKPSEETTTEFPLSSMFVFQETGAYQVLVSRYILREGSETGLRSYAQVLETSQSRLLRFVVGTNGLQRVQLSDGSWQDVLDSTKKKVSQ